MEHDGWAVWGAAAAKTARVRAARARKSIAKSYGFVVGVCCEWAGYCRWVLLVGLYRPRRRLTLVCAGAVWQGAASGEARSSVAG